MPDHSEAQRDQAAAVQMGNVMIKCTESGEGVPAGLRIDAASFETSNFTETVTCPHCGHEHTWSTKDAWIEHVY